MPTLTDQEVQQLLSAASLIQAAFAPPIGVPPQTLEQKAAAITFSRSITLSEFNPPVDSLVRLLVRDTNIDVSGQGGVQGIITFDRPDPATMNPHTRGGTADYPGVRKLLARFGPLETEYLVNGKWINAKDGRENAEVAREDTHPELVPAGISD